MRYVISDIHGCFKQYKNLLEKIHFTEEDTLYVLGDVVDRGPEPIKVLQDMMKRKNVIHIIGNHDYIMYMILKRLLNSAKTGGSISAEEQKLYKLWMEDGGFVTIKGFLDLDETARNKILQYIENSSVYEEIFCEEKKYILVHAGIQNFKNGVKNYISICGHWNPKGNGIWKNEKGNVLICDCGCGFSSGRLGCLCLETEEIIYV